MDKAEIADAFAPTASTLPGRKVSAEHVDVNNDENNENLILKEDDSADEMRPIRPPWTLYRALDRSEAILALVFASFLAFSAVMLGVIGALDGIFVGSFWRTHWAMAGALGIVSVALAVIEVRGLSRFADALEYSHEPTAIGAAVTQTTRSIQDRNRVVCTSRGRDHRIRRVSFSRVAVPSPVGRRTGDHRHPPRGQGVGCGLCVERLGGMYVGMPDRQRTGRPDLLARPIAN